MPLHALRFTAPLHRHRELTGLLIELAEEELARETEPEGRSISSYTLRNLWADTDRKKARRYSVQAIRASSFYADKAYFWSELGAYLFNYRRFSAALRCYEHAYEKLGKTERRSRYGDALMYVGRYSDALRVFEVIANDEAKAESHQNEVHLDVAEATIKALALKHIKQVYGIESQKRQTHSARDRMDQDHNISDADMLSRCDAAIREDALCHRGWFNRGVILNKQGKREEALWSFLVAASAGTEDDEAWLNVMILAFEHHRDYLPTLLIYLTHERGSAFVRYMTENAQGRANEGERAMLMELARLLATQIPKRKEAVVRLHGPDGTKIITGPAR